MRNGMGWSGRRVRRPLGSMTTKDAGSGSAEGAVISFAGGGGPRGAGASFGRRGGLANLFHLARAERLAMRAVSADLGARQQHLEPEVAFDLFAQPLQRIAEKFLHLAAAEAHDVRVFLLEPRLVVMLVAREM